ncbi:MAG: hypothetical protein VZR13_05870 [Saccharofermentanaceae bacterium]|nr:hypothetical protein [Saccharofermentanaceae bacterium]
MNRNIRYTSSGRSGMIRRTRWQGMLSLLLAALLVLILPLNSLLALDPETTASGDQAVAGESGESKNAPDVDYRSKGVGQQEMELPSLDKVQCASYFCYDRTTRQVIIAKDENKKVFPASMTKILTLALALEYLDPHEIITVSKTAMDATTPNSTMMGVVAGEELEANELYFGMMLPSGNDAANVLAEEIAKHYNAQKGALPTTTPLPTPPADGSPATEDPNKFTLIGQFAYIANMKIQELGLTNSHFMNPNGLHNDRHYTTSHDLAMMFDYALNFEDFCTVISAPTHFFKADNKHPFDGWKKVSNTNHLLTDPYMIGMDAHCAQVFGGKTGTTKVAGTGMTVLTINENGHEIITCVCGIPYDVADHQTVYIAAIVREANLKCWESDPVHRVDGNVIDNRGYNSPKEQGPSGSKGNVTVSSPESTEETLAPTETTQAPSVTEASSVTPAPQAEKKGFMEKHPVLVIVLAVLSTIVVIMIILTIISVSRVKKRRKTGIRKVRF